MVKGRYPDKMTSRKAALLSPALVETISRSSTALRRAGVSFSVIGAVALGARGYRRFTEDVDFLIDPEKRGVARVALRKIGIVPGGGFNDSYLAQLVDSKTGAGVDLLFAVGDPEESARLSATSAVAEGVRVRVAKPEYLIWLYLLSDRPQHMADGIELLATGKVNLRRLETLLNLAGVRRELRPRLTEWVVRAELLRRSRGR